MRTLYLLPILIFVAASSLFLYPKQTFLPQATAQLNRTSFGQTSSITVGCLIRRSGDTMLVAMAGAIKNCNFIQSGEKRMRAWKTDI